jgi:hypothetical protein
MDGANTMIPPGQPNINVPSVKQVDAPSPFPGGRPFRADVDMAELDSRGRPGATWTAHSQHLGRGNLSVLTRRVAYEGSTLVVAVHLLDSEPTVLCGVVRACDYVGEGIHRLILDLQPVPSVEEVTRWAMGRAPRRTAG